MAENVNPTPTPPPKPHPDLGDAPVRLAGGFERPDGAGWAEAAILAELFMTRSNRHREVVLRTGVGSLPLVGLIARGTVFRTDYPLFPWYFVTVAAYIVLIVLMGWHTERRLRHLVLRLTEWGIYVGADDGRWDGVRRQNVAWSSITEVRIVENWWSRKIEVVSAGYPLRLSFPQSSRIAPVHDLDAIGEAICQHGWLHHRGMYAAAPPVDRPPPTRPPAPDHLP